MGSSGIFKEFHAVIVPVSKLETTSAWYQDVLELQPLREVPGMVVLGAGGTAHICLYQAAGEQDVSGNMIVNFRAENLDETNELLRRRGITCSDIEHMPMLRYLTIHDPESNRIDVCEYGPDWL